MAGSNARLDAAIIAVTLTLATQVGTAAISWGTIRTQVTALQEQLAEERQARKELQQAWLAEIKALRAEFQRFQIEQAALHGRQ